MNVLGPLRSDITRCKVESSCHLFIRQMLRIRVCNQLPLSLHVASLSCIPCSSSRAIAPCMTVCLVPNLILSSFTPPSRINATLFDRSPLHFTIFLTRPSSAVTFLTSICYLNSVCIISNFFLPFASCSCASRSSLRLHFTVSSSSFHHFPSQTRFWCVS